MYVEYTWLLLRVLSYAKIKIESGSQYTLWWAMTGSNCRPPGCKPDALPTELIALISDNEFIILYYFTNYKRKK